MRILASVGQQLAEFVHETNGILALARQVSTLLRPPKGTPTPAAVRSAGESADQLVRLIDRQASYLVEVLSPDSRRRRSRRQLARAVHSAAQLVSARAENRGIVLAIEVSSSMDTVPMFGAELTTVFTNLLTNAVKAAGNSGRIRVAGHSEREWSVITVENTGTAVNLANAERWFQPFESTTSEADPVLGVGMGLGLTIVRSTLADYGGTVRFVEPSDGYGTAVEVRIPRTTR
jgi:signal transduction histidine kinase